MLFRGLLCFAFVLVSSCVGSVGSSSPELNPEALGIAGNRLASDTSALAEPRGFQMRTDAPGLSESVDAHSGQVRAAVDVASVPGFAVQARYSSASTAFSWNPSLPNGAGLGTYWNESWFGRFRWDLRHRNFGTNQQDNTTRAGDAFNGGSAGLEMPDGSFQLAYFEPPGAADMPPFGDSTSADWSQWQRRSVASPTTIAEAQGRLADGSRWRVIRSQQRVIPGPSLNMEFQLPDEIEVTATNGTILRFAHRVGRPEENADEANEFPHEFSPSVTGQTLPVQFTALYLTEIEEPQGAIIRFHYYGQQASCSEQERTPIPRMVETGRRQGANFEAAARITFHFDANAGGIPGDRCDLGSADRIAAVRYPGPNTDPTTPSAQWRRTTFEYCAATSATCSTARADGGPDLVAVHTGTRAFRFSYQDVTFRRPFERRRNFWIPIPLPIPGETGLQFIVVGQNSRRIRTVEFQQPRLTSIELPGGDRLEYSWDSQLHLIDGVWRDRAPWVDLGIPFVPRLGGELDSGFAAFVDGVRSRTLLAAHGPAHTWDIHHAFLRRGALSYSVAVVENPRLGDGPRPSSLFMHEPLQVGQNSAPEALTYRPSSARVGVLLESRHYQNSVWCSVDGDERGELCADAFQRNTLLRREQFGYSVHFAGLNAKPDRMNRFSSVAQCVNGSNTLSDDRICRDRQYAPAWIAHQSHHVVSISDGNSGASSQNQCCYQTWRVPVSSPGERVVQSCARSGSSAVRPSCGAGWTVTDENCMQSDGVRFRRCERLIFPSGTIVCGSDSSSNGSLLCGDSDAAIGDAQCQAMSTCGTPSSSGVVSTVTTYRGDIRTRFNLGGAGEWDRDQHAAFELSWTTDRPVEIERSAALTGFPRCSYNELYRLQYTGLPVARWENVWGCALLDSTGYHQDALSSAASQMAEDPQIKITRYVHQGSGTSALSYQQAGMTHLVRSTETYAGMAASGTPIARIVFGYDNEPSVSLGGTTASAAYPDSSNAAPLSRHSADVSTAPLGRVTATFEVDPTNPANHRAVHQLYAASGGTAPPGILLEQSFRVDASGTRRRIRYGYEDWRSPSWSAQYAIGGGETRLTATRDVDALGYVHETVDAAGTSMHQCFDGEGRLRAAIPGTRFVGCSNEEIARAPLELRYVDAGTIGITEIARGAGNTLVSHKFFDGLGRTIGSQSQNGGRIWGSYRSYVGTQDLPFEESVAAPVAAAEITTLAFPTSFDALPRTRTHYDGLGRESRIEVFEPSSATPHRTRTSTYGLVVRSSRGVARTRFFHDTVDASGATAARRESTIFDGRFRPVEVRLPGRGENEYVAYSYDARGNPDVIRHADGAESNYDVDAFGRVTLATRPESGTTLSEYDYTDTVVRVTQGYRGGSGVSTVRHEFDPFGRPKRVLDGSGGILREYFYDGAMANSLLSSSAQPNLTNRLARVASRDGTTTDFGYDAFGRVRETATEYPGLGVRRSTTDLDEIGQVITRRYQPGQSDGISFAYAYDNLGEVREVRAADATCNPQIRCGDANGDGAFNSSDLSFAEAGQGDQCARQRADITGPQGRSDGVVDRLDLEALQRVLLRAVGSPTQAQLRCDGATIYRASFDEGQYRQTNFLLPDSAQPQQEVIRHDHWGRLHSVNDPEVVHNAPFGMRLRYDESFPGAASGEAGGGRADGKVSSIEWTTPTTCPANTVAVSSASYCESVERAGRQCFRLNATTFCAAEVAITESCGGTAVASAALCGEGRCYRATACSEPGRCAPTWCTQACTANSDDPACSDQRREAYLYDYDAAGQLTEALLRRHDGRAWIAADREPGSSSMRYDSVGNLTRMTRSTSAGAVPTEYASGRLLANVSGGQNAAFTYDAIGRVAVDVRANARFTFAYNADSAVHSITQERTDVRTDRFVRRVFGYGPDGRRFRTQVQHSSMSPGSAWTTLSDQVDTGFATYENGRLQSWNLPLVGLRIPRGSSMGDAGDYIQFEDHLGTIRATVDGASHVHQVGNVDAFGAARDGSNLNLFGNAQLSDFTGYQRTGYRGDTPATDFVGSYQHAQFRVYDPSIGRFSQPDPMADHDVTHAAYTYAYNQPNQLTDPLGLCPGGICIGGRALSMQGFIMAGGITAGEALSAFVQGLLTAVGETILVSGVSKWLMALACSNPITCAIAVGATLGLAAYQIIDAWEEIKGRYTRIVGGEGTWDDWYGAGHDLGSVLGGGKIARSVYRLRTGVTRIARRHPRMVIRNAPDIDAFILQRVRADLHKKTLDRLNALLDRPLSARKWHDAFTRLKAQADGFGRGNGSDTHGTIFSDGTVQHVARDGTIYEANILDFLD